MKIYVGNLPFNATEDLLHKTFAPYGKVLSARIARSEDGRMRGYGHVLMDSEESGEKAISAVNGTELNGRNCLVAKHGPEWPSPQPNGGTYFDAEMPIVLMTKSGISSWKIESDVDLVFDVCDQGEAVNTAKIGAEDAFLLCTSAERVTWEADSLTLLLWRSWWTGEEFKEGSSYLARAEDSWTTSKSVFSIAGGEMMFFSSRYPAEQALEEGLPVTLARGDYRARFQLSQIDDCEIVFVQLIPS